MNTENVDLFCMGCFEQLETSGSACPACGYDESAQAVSPHQLRPRTILNGKYLLGRVLGEGGFGITYIGWDLNLDVKVAIKEYYPNGVVTRDGTTTVFPFSGTKTEIFTSGRDRFVREAKNLAKFYALPGIVSVKDYFQENGTAYIVMEFVEGVTLKAKLADAGGKLPIAEVLEYMKPIVKSLYEVHNAGIIHRDISPDNMIITKEGNSKLIDFGAARGVSDGQQSLSVLLKPGFAPEEQYRTRGVQGAWSDVYAICATIYRAVTGVTPDEAVERIRDDSLEAPRKMGVSMPDEQEKAVMKGLAVYQADRFQTVMELYAALYGPMTGTVAAPVTAPVPTLNPEQNPAPVPSQETIPTAFSKEENPILSWITKNKYVSTAIGGLCIILLVVFLAQGLAPSADLSDDPALMAAATSEPASPSLSPSASAKASSGNASAQTLAPSPGATAGNGVNISGTGSPPSQASNAPLSAPQQGTITIGGETVDINVTELLLQEKGISDISELAKLSKLEDMNLHGNKISDISALSNLKNLKMLWLTGNQITDVSALAGLTNLTTLYIGANQIEDIRPLAKLTNLEALGIHMSNISDISVLSNFKKLRILQMSESKVSDLRPLTGLANLTSLHMNRCGLSDISALADLPQLSTLNISSNNVRDITVLSNFPNLTVLYLNNNKISDISVLFKLQKLEKIYLDENPLTQKQVDELKAALPKCEISAKNITGAATTTTAAATATPTPAATATPRPTATPKPTATPAPATTKVTDQKFTYPDPYMSGATGTYTGDWKDGLPNGKGTFVFDKKYSDMGYPAKYTGAWVNGAKHGQGTATWKDGTTYTGSFKNNKKDGKGKMTNSDGSVYWDGNWKDDAPVK